MRHNLIKVIPSLITKGCKIHTEDTDGVRIIDVSAAKDLGNGSWGKIDYLVNNFNYALIGLTQYNKTTRPVEKEKIQKEQKQVEKKEKQWHSYAGIYPSYDYKGNKLPCSEFGHLLQLNHLNTKFNRSLMRTTKSEKMKMKAIKKKIAAGNGRKFENQKIWSTEFEPKDIPTNAKQLS